MKILLILLGVFWVVMGVMLVILTDAIKEVLRNLLKQKNLKLLSVLPFIVGIILISSSSLVSLPWITVTLGVLAILKGLFFAFGPVDKTKPLIDWWLNASSPLLKSWGVVVFLLGVLILLIIIL